MMQKFFQWIIRKGFRKLFRYSQSSQGDFWCWFQPWCLSVQVRLSESSEKSLKFEDFSVNWHPCSTSSFYSSFFRTLYIFLTSSSVWISLTHTNRAATPICIISIKLQSKLWNFSLALQASSAPDTSLPSLNLPECTMGRYGKQGTCICP